MLNWSLKTFNQLTINELYDLLKLRSAIFVVEQNCPYLDLDDRDQPAWHLLGRDADGDLVAYTRLIPIGFAYEKYAAIGRVVTSEKVRGRGFGRTLMLRSIAEIQQLFPDAPVKIGAQAHLEHFYRSVGFVPTGEAYLEDSIPHISMVLTNEF
jgi:ElaA protein